MTLRVGVVGAGYWGPNLVRNFRGSPDWDLVAVCDLDEARAREGGGRAQHRGRGDLARAAAGARRTSTRWPIATPARTHGAIALAALEAGKHVLVEKPLAVEPRRTPRRWSTRRGERGLVLMCDHTYCYTPAVQQIREHGR